MKTLFDVIQYLIRVNEKLEKGQIPINTAKAISINAQVIVNAAKLELEYAKISKRPSRLFLNAAEDVEAEVFPEEDTELVVSELGDLSIQIIQEHIDIADRPAENFLNWITAQGQESLPRNEKELIIAYQVWLEEPPMPIPDKVKENLDRETEFIARYLKGLCDIDEEDSIKFLNWLHAKGIKTRKQLGDASALFNEWLKK
jgi:hypothetical protein